MILKFTWENFYSFKEKNTVSFVVNQKAPCTDSYADMIGKGKRISKIMACFGPNASGKTNLLKVLPFLSWFIQHSFDLKPDDKIPIQPFRFERGEKPCKFTVDFLHDQHVYRYILELTSKRIIDEQLFIMKGRGFQYLFKRTWNKSAQKFDFVTKNFDLSGSFGDFLQMRQNASALSIALQHNHENSKQIVRYWSGLLTNVFELGREFRTEDLRMKVFQSAEYFYRHSSHKDQAQDMLKLFDLGLAGIEIKEQEIGLDKEGKPQKIIIPYGLHVGKDQSTHKLPFYYESSGTQSLLIILRQILPVLDQGGIAVIDEFEVDLHPHMIPPLVNLFLGPTNPNNAQLLFSCHSTELLKQLDKYQVLFVEKDEYGYSRVFRLDEVKGIRSDDNIYAKYDAGAYGAVPNI